MGSSNGNSTSKSNLPRHVAIIMDGNGRWAKRRHLPRIEGHRQGAKTVHMVVEECRRLGVEYLTLFAFSTENWQRPAEEVSALMKLFEHYLQSELSRLLENGIRLRAIGDLDRLPVNVRSILRENEEATKNLQGMQLILAVSYGGREEILNAARKLAKSVEQGKRSADSIDAQALRNELYGHDIPDPDLLIRTSDENRISNFLLWQLAYSEIVVSPLFWPEFSKEEFHRCIAEYGKRTRRFGLIDEQLGQQGINGNS
jgi:undecaprenyl diphosphate synthase